MLELNGFSSLFISLVMHCVETVRFQVLLNGSPLRSFKPQRGIRQGDPLSPFLFILCSDVLSRLLLQQEREGLIHGIKIARNAPPVSHLMFADDTILFCRANKEEAECLDACLEIYGKWSGQEINRQKSSIYISRNTAVDQKRRIKDTLTLLVGL